MQAEVTDALVNTSFTPSNAISKPLQALLLQNFVVTVNLSVGMRLYFAQCLQAVPLQGMITAITFLVAHLRAWGKLRAALIVWESP